MNYFDEPFSEKSLGELLKKANLRPIEAVRKGEAAFKESGFTADTDDADVLALIVANPGLLQRPIVEVGDKAVMARPIEKALELL